MYFFTPNSTFYDQPYLDKMLASSATNHFPSRLRRINVIYQSNSDPNDISVRTLPGTKDFYVPSAQAINEKFSNLESTSIYTTNWYYDKLSLSDNATRLIALRILMETDFEGARIMLEAEVNKDILDYALTKVFSFPSVKVLLVNVFANNTSYTLMGQSAEIPSWINISQYLQDGLKNISVGTD